jgi:hypothetical protein
VKARRENSPLENSCRWLSASLVLPTVSRGARVKSPCADQTVERQLRCGLCATAQKRRDYVSRRSWPHSDLERGDCVAANALRAEINLRNVPASWPVRLALSV